MFNQFDVLERFKSSEIKLIPKSLRLGERTREEVKFFRLLIGSAQIRNNITGETFPQNINYSYLGPKINSRFSKRLFHDFLGGVNWMNNLSEYFKYCNLKNTSLFRDLINEYCFYHDFQYREQHTLAFLYLYRILERISLTFPMLYASKATDYIGTYNQLQNYFKGASNSELAFYNLFIS